MKMPILVSDVFRSIDSGDVDGFVQYLTGDVQFRAANNETILGREAVRENFKLLLSSIKAMHHIIDDTLVRDDSVVVHGTVTYTRLDGSALTVPFADIWTMEGEKIKKFLIFVDNTQI